MIISPQQSVSPLWDFPNASSSATDVALHRSLYLSELTSILMCRHLGLQIELQSYWLIT